MKAPKNRSIIQQFTNLLNAATAATVAALVYMQSVKEEP